jgi:uncharacterized protein YndB with AHSA1/START domain
VPRPGADAGAPIRKSVLVSWSPEAAFQRFTADFAKWWPAYGHSIGRKRVQQMVFELRVGGLIYEEHHDGTRFMWGRVTALEPPRRVAFTHHASRAESDAQDVEVTFTPEGGGTRLDLVSRGWEKMSLKARKARGGYGMTWSGALDAYAGRWSAVRLFFIAMSAAIDLTGQRGAFMRGSLGGVPAPSTGEKQQ